MKPKAIILTNGLLSKSDAKTAHGLIRGTDRFDIVGIIDAEHVGCDLSAIVGEKVREIPVFPGLKKALAIGDGKIDYVIVGVAPKGGKLPSDMKAILLECLDNNISIISGLHEFISNMPRMAARAERKGLTITDIRKPKDRQELHFWTGEIFDVECPIVAVLGMDTNMGKRTTAKILRDTCQRHDIQAEMVYTGQTGWLQDGKYGFIFDTTVNDFVSGELEYWICKCFKEAHPDVIFIEGQAGLRNPSGPCGAEFLISGNARQVVLVFSPKKKYFNDRVSWGALPSLEDEIKLIRMYGSEVIALVINTKGYTEEESMQLKEQYSAEFGLPVLLPLEQGVEELLPAIRQMVHQLKEKA